MSRTAPLQVRLTEDQRAKAEARADAEGISLSSFLRDALEAYVTSPCKRCGGTGKEP